MERVFAYREVEQLIPDWLWATTKGLRMVSD
jgi:hypothetical protein